MAKSSLKKPKRGPGRAKHSKVKIKCCWKGCKSGADVKNRPFQLPLKDVDWSLCRPLRSHCKLVRFCCQGHLSKSRVVTPTKKRGGREPLTAQQVACVFWALVHDSRSPWAAVMWLLQLCLGERADCTRQASSKWFNNLNPTSTGSPTCSIPAVNLKTQERIVPLEKSLAELIWTWVTKEPLRGPGNSQWPWKGQDLQASFESAEDTLLFPGRVYGGKNVRNWTSAITERSYAEKIAEACKAIAKEKKQAADENKPHPCSDLDLDRVGTHSLKKTTVTLLKSCQTATSIVSAITGTSARTLDSTYDVPTLQRQRKAISTAISPVLECVQNTESTGSQADFCRFCDKPQQSCWLFCPYCGNQNLV